MRRSTLRVPPQAQALIIMLAFRQLTANDAKTKLLDHVSRDKLKRLEDIKDRIGKLSNRSSAAAEMLADIQSVTG